MSDDWNCVPTAEGFSVQYIWTEMDVKNSGTSPGKEQDGLVTPYGFTAGVQGNWAAGAQVPLDMNKTKKFAWRAQRFHVGSGSKSDADYEWIAFDPPDSVETLKDLCNHLAGLDKDRYPRNLYVYDATSQYRADAADPAWMLFDFWGNSQYRAETIANGFSWPGYAGYRDLKVKAPTGRKIRYVLALKQKLPVQKTSTPTLGGVPLPIIVVPNVDWRAEIEAYIGELNACCDTIQMLFDTTAEAMNRLAAPISQLHGVAAIAAVSKEGDAPAVFDLANDVAKQAYDLLMKEPARRGGQMDRLLEEDKLLHKFTRDAGADLAVYRAKLHALLMTPNPYAKSIAPLSRQLVDFSDKDLEWDFERMFAVPLVADPAFPQLEADKDYWLKKRLALATYRALDYLGRCGPDVDDDGVPTTPNDTFLKHIDDAPDKAAMASADESTTPLSVTLATLGKGLKTMQRGRSLSMKLVQIYATREIANFARVGTRVRSDFGAMFLAEIEKRLPDTDGNIKLREKFRKAFNEKDEKELGYLAAEFSEAENKLSSTWKNAAAVLTIASTVLSLVNYKKDEREAVEMIHFMGTGTGVVTCVLGTAERVLGALACAEKAAALLGKLGKAVDAVSSIFGIVSGAVTVVDAWKKVPPNWFAVTSGVLEVSSSLASVLAWMLVVAEVGGEAAQIIEAVALALLIVSGTISLTEVVFEMTGPQTNVVASHLAAAAAADPIFVALSKKSVALTTDMAALQAMLKTCSLPIPEETDDNVARLKAAGISEKSRLDIFRFQKSKETAIGTMPWAI